MIGGLFSIIPTPPPALMPARNNDNFRKNLAPILVCALWEILCTMHAARANQGGGILFLTNQRICLLFGR